MDITKKGTVRDVEASLLQQASPKVYRPVQRAGGLVLEPNELTVEQALQLRERMKAQTILSSTTAQIEMETKLDTRRLELELAEIEAKKAEIDSQLRGKDEGFVAYMKEALESFQGQIFELREQLHQKDLAMAESRMAALQETVRSLQTQMEARSAPSGLPAVPASPVAPLLQTVQDYKSLQEAMESLAPKPAVSVSANDDPGFIIGMRKLELEDRRELRRIELSQGSSDSLRERELEIQREQAEAEKARAQGALLLAQEIIPTIREAVAAAIEFMKTRPATVPATVAPSVAAAPPIVLLTCNSCGHRFTTAENAAGEYVCPRCASGGREAEPEPAIYDITPSGGQVTIR